MAECTFTIGARFGPTTLKGDKVPLSLNLRSFSPRWGERPREPLFVESFVFRLARTLAPPGPQCASKTWWLSMSPKRRNRNTRGRTATTRRERREISGTFNIRHSTFNVQVNAEHCRL